MRRDHKLFGLWDALTSLKFTIACLAMLMVLVAACTLAQVQLGAFNAVKLYFRSFFLYWTPRGTAWNIPYFPAGGAVGALLIINLAAGHLCRLERSWRKLGIWFVHLGLVLLFIGEFVTGFAAVESRMAIDEGRTMNFAENPREAEIAIVDSSEPDADTVFSVSEKVFSRKMKIENPRLPFALLVKRYYANAALEPRTEADRGVSSMATAGEGKKLLVFERPPKTADDQVNEPAAFVELINGDASLGTWLLSDALSGPQAFSYEGRKYLLSMRPMRYYLPFSITLKKFSHDVYPGTDIPKNFSSLVHLKDPARGEDRDVAISMNHPLRYGGKTFYQASFAKNDTLSIFQVVRNPGWLLPYVSCALVVLGLLIHFLTRLSLPSLEAQA